MIDRIKKLFNNCFLHISHLIKFIRKLFNKYFLHIAFIVSLITYSFWKIIKDFTGYRIFYIGVAVFILMLSYQLYKDNKKSFIRFLIYELSFVNLIKELFLDPGKLALGEALLIVIIPFIWYLKHDKYNRILERNILSSRNSVFVYYREKICKIFRKKATS